MRANSRAHRHYAGAAKQYKTGKSFHQDETLKGFEDPEQLKVILEKIGKDSRVSGSDFDYIPFKYNGTIYAVHTKTDEKHIGSRKIPYNRLQTFYPVGETAELETLTNDYDEVMIDSTLSAYVKK